MRITKIIVLLLCAALIMGFMAACNETAQNETQPSTVQTEPQVQKHSINPALYDAFGEEMIASEEETIEKLVKGLETCYKQYKTNNNCYEFAVSVDKAMEPYKGYLKEISNELMNMSKNATDPVEKQKLLTLHGQSIGYIAAESTWSSYKFFIDMDMDSTFTEQDAAEALIKYINAISNFFYCKPIAE